jgi:plasmid stabilization system protein ParE
MNPVSWSTAQEGRDAAELLLVVLERRVAGLAEDGRGRLGRDVDVLGVRRGEHPAVRALQVRDVEDLLGLEVAEVDHGDRPLARSLM